MWFYKKYDVVKIANIKNLYITKTFNNIILLLNSGSIEHKI